MQIGLKDLHVAKLVEDTQGKLTYEAVKALKNAVSAKINPSINNAEVYADDQLVKTFSILGKIDVEIETSELSIEDEAFLLGNTVKEGVLIKNKDDVPPEIALGFKSLKANKKYRFVWLLKGTAQPIGDEYASKKNNIEVKTPKIKLTFMPRIKDGDWKHTADEDTVGFTGSETWFSKVPGQTVEG